MTTSLRRRPGRFARFLARLADLFRAQADMRALTIIDPPVEYETPALHDGFGFRVKVRLQWTVRGEGTDADLHRAVNGRREGFRWLVADKVRHGARRFPPHLPEQAEAHLAESLVPIVVTEHDGTQVTCTPYVWIGSARPLVEFRQRTWLERLTAETAHETAQADIARLRELRALWRAFLSEGMDDWMTTYALRLAERKQDAAGVHTEMVDHRREDAQRLLEMVEKIIAGHRITNAYEFMVDSETVLKRTLQMMGVPLPPAPPNGAASPN
ncbi:hypothetical protein HNP84_008397 [Thermocatellispora tengchongensis]|uniref:Uncharacterized protein n=1 Tax=Thermocatellispora tengchongensis TaxID=1073253 RepID=A0A840PL14_9ACTN|nr:hypothetical protein [Thermocatellispora tengchongensis]MBB5138643.1 hypothetical protein [Thermocatellispora tengchongensis]